MQDVLKVLSPGILTSVQDLGRFGYAHLGVSASGAADSLSARISNRLLGNDDNAPILEMTLLGGRFEFGSGTTIALAGADFAATLDGSPVPCYAPVPVAAGAILQCGQAGTGARCYLAVAGGFEIVPTLGSTSTHLMSGIGGVEGRALKRGDVLQINLRKVAKPKRVDLQVIQRLRPRSTLRVTDGPQHEVFGKDALRNLCAQSYRVSEDSNRIGLRLRSQPIIPMGEFKMPTEGAALGAIQIPPGGEPIILFVEHQTTGGYPKIANVITADMPSVGQLRPGDEIGFESVTMEQAIDLLKTQEEILRTAFA
jgi:antagonist of KipI